MGVERSAEYGADIINACESGKPLRNVPNTFDGMQLIDHLPADCCAEVPWVADATGIKPEPVGTLPRHLAALMQTNVNVQGLTVEGALTGRREPVYHAAMLETAAELPLDELRRLVDEFLNAHEDWIPPLAPAATRAGAPS
jgi:alpha-galactosidase